MRDTRGKKMRGTGHVITVAFVNGWDPLSCKSDDYGRESGLVFIRFGLFK